MFENFRRDLGRYFALDSADGNPGLAEKARIVVADAGQIQATAVYRFGSWARGLGSRAARAPLMAAHFAAERVTEMMWGIRIHVGAKVGPGLYIGHPHGVLIGPGTLGEDCNIAANVTIGRRTDGKSDGLPTIGDRVWIGVNAVVFGKIVVGEGTSIGANTVVSRNVPPRSLVQGQTMQVISRDHDNTAQIYGAGGAAAAGSKSGK